MKLLYLVTVCSLFINAVDARNNLARTPPMGWMSWELFRCDVNCTTDPENCISEHLYKAQTDSLVSGGFLAAGYTGIHMDDCWVLTALRPSFEILKVLLTHRNKRTLLVIQLLESSAQNPLVSLPALPT